MRVPIFIQICLVLIYISSNGYAQEGPNLLWEHEGSSEVIKLSFVPDGGISNLVVMSAGATENHIFVFDLKGNVINKEDTLSPDFSTFSDGFVLFNNGWPRGISHYDRNGNFEKIVEMPYKLDSFSITRDGRNMLATIQLPETDPEVLLLDSSGNRLWRDSKNNFIGILKIALADEGDIFCTYSMHLTKFSCYNTGGRFLWEYSQPKYAFITTVALSSEGDWILVGTENSMFYLLDRNGETVLEKEIGSGKILGISVSSDGDHIGLGTQDGYISLLGPGGGLIWEHEVGDPVNTVSVSSDGKYMAAGTKGGKIYVFETTPLKEAVVEPYPMTPPPVTSPPTTAPPTLAPMLKYNTIPVGSVEVGDTMFLTKDRFDQYQPAWSPDSGKIAYQSTQSGNPDIWVMGADGARHTQLTADDSWQYDPSWSPAGERIVYVSEELGNPDIWVMEPDGEEKKRLTTDLSHEQEPVFSPDGKWIAYTSDLAGNLDIWVMHSDGTEKTQVTFDPTPQQSPVWDPKGYYIYHISEESGFKNIWVTDLFGDTQKNLFHESFDSDMPSPSPDGNWLAHTSGPSGDEGVHIRALDGSYFLQIAPYGNSPVWSPDGTKVAYATNEEGNFDIAVVKLRAISSEKDAQNAIDKAAEMVEVARDKFHSGAWRLDDSTSMLISDLLDESVHILGKSQISYSNGDYDSAIDYANSAIENVNDIYQIRDSETSYTPPPPMPPEVLFYDYFEDGPAGEWKFIEGEWRVIDGVLTLWEQSRAGDGLALVDIQAAPEYTVDTSLMVEGLFDNPVGLVFNAQSEEDYLELMIVPDEVLLVEKHNGKHEILQSVNMEINRGEWYNLRVIVHRGFLECYINDKQIFVMENPYPKGGMVGLVSDSSNANIHFDSFMVQSGAVILATLVEANRWNIFTFIALGASMVAFLGILFWERRISPEIRGGYSVKKKGIISYLVMAGNIGLGYLFLLIFYTIAPELSHMVQKVVIAAPLFYLGLSSFLLAYSLQKQRPYLKVGTVHQYISGLLAVFLFYIYFNHIRGIDPPPFALPVLVSISLAMSTWYDRMALLKPGQVEEISEKRPVPAHTGVDIRRGGEIIGSTFIYKVKIVNSSSYRINDIVIRITGLPLDCMSINTKERELSYIEPHGAFRSMEFKLTPTKDCVQGTVNAVVMYSDASNVQHSVVVEPFTIRSVCDLLQPYMATKSEIEDIIGSLKEKAGEEIKIAGWTGEELFTKTKAVLPLKNFNVSDAESKKIGGTFIGTITAIAKGKYTGKKVALKITVTQSGGDLTTVLVEGIGEDAAMLPTALDELERALKSQTCPFCGGELNETQVKGLKAGEDIKCEYCNKLILSYKE